MTWLLLALLIPVLIGLGCTFFEVGPRLTVRQVVAAEVVVFVITLFAFQFLWDSGVSDVEHLNGTVVSKRSGITSCCHCVTKCDTCNGPHDCNCRQVYDHHGDGGWTTECDTCYGDYECNCRTVCDHASDFEGKLTLSNGDVHKFGPCSAGSKATWDSAYRGEPAVMENTYTNYLKAHPDSALLPEADAEFMAQVPEFPRIFARFRVNKVLSQGVGGFEVWEEGVSKLNADLGQKKQVDVIVLFTQSADPDWADAVARKWQLGPKNALIIVAGVPDGAVPQIKWVRTVSLSDVGALTRELRRGLEGLLISEHAEGVRVIREAVDAKFQRTPMADFAYMATTNPPSWWWVLGFYFLVIVVTLVCGAISGEFFKDSGARVGFYAWFAVGGTVLLIWCGVALSSWLWKTTELERAVSLQHRHVELERAAIWREVQEANGLKPESEALLRRSLQALAQERHRQSVELLDKALEASGVAVDERSRAPVLRVMDAHRDELVQSHRHLDDRQRHFSSFLKTKTSETLNVFGVYPRAVKGSTTPDRDRDGDGRLTVLDHR